MLTKNLLLAAFATSLVFAPKVYADNSIELSSPKIQRVTYDKIHFHGIPSINDDGQIKFEFSIKRPGPKTASFRFWGISITQTDELRRLLQDRALSCWQIFEIDGVGLVDCTVSPSRGAEQLLGVSAPNWLDVFTWLPELGLATKLCNFPQNLQVTTRDPEVAYFCRTSNGQVSERSNNQAIPIRAMPLVPAPY